MIRLPFFKKQKYEKLNIYFSFAYLCYIPYFGKISNESCCDSIGWHLC